MQGRLIVVHLACRDMDSFDMTGPDEDIAVAASSNGRSRSKITFRNILHLIYNYLLTCFIIDSDLLFICFASLFSLRSIECINHLKLDVYLFIIIIIIIISFVIFFSYIFWLLFIISGTST